MQQCAEVNRDLRFRLKRQGNRKLDARAKVRYLVELGMTELAVFYEHAQGGIGELIPVWTAGQLRSAGSDEGYELAKLRGLT
jgi:hypothetical protein